MADDDPPPPTPPPDPHASAPADLRPGLAALSRGDLATAAECARARLATCECYDARWCVSFRGRRGGGETAVQGVCGPGGVCGGARGRGERPGTGQQRRSAARSEEEEEKTRRDARRVLAHTPPCCALRPPPTPPTTHPHQNLPPPHHTPAWPAGPLTTRASRPPPSPSLRPRPAWRRPAWRPGRGWPPPGRPVGTMRARRPCTMGW